VPPEDTISDLELPEWSRGLGGSPLWQRAKSYKSSLAPARTGHLIFRTKEKYQGKALSFLSNFQSVTVGSDLLSSVLCSRLGGTQGVRPSQAPRHPPTTGPDPPCTLIQVPTRWLKSLGWSGGGGGGGEHTARKPSLGAWEGLGGSTVCELRRQALGLAPLSYWISVKKKTKQNTNSAGRVTQGDRAPA
jgi:hypothetical protein